MPVPAVRAAAAGSTAPPPLLSGSETDASLLSPEDLHNPVRRMGFFVALVFLVLRFGYVHEYLATMVGTSFYLLLISGTLVTLAALISGGLRRMFAAHPARWWIAFAVWLAITIPFSSWKTASALLFLSYLRITIAVLLVTAGLPLTTKECFRFLYALALAAVFSIVVAGYFGRNQEDRLGMPFGSMGNQNDIAAHFLYILPFLLFLVLRLHFIVFRVMASALLIFGIYVHLRTGSRGGLISLAVVAVLFLFIAPMWARLLVVFLTILGLLVAPLLLPPGVKERYATILASEGESTLPQDAEASSISRRYLLETSLAYTFQHPIFGVGPGEFADVEGGQAAGSGRRGLWQVTHNAYTQVSSEMGIPGLVIYLGAIVSTFRVLRSVRKRCRPLPQFGHAATAAFCMMLSMAGFCAAILFLSLAYTFYLPALTGLAVALDRAVRHEMAGAGQPAAEGQSAGGARGNAVQNRVRGRGGMRRPAQNPILTERG